MDLSSPHSYAVQGPAIGRCFAVAMLLCVITTTAHAKNGAPAYPIQIRGTWMPDDISCSSPVNYDSDSLIDIGRNVLGHYEDSSKVTRALQISKTPAAWKIDSLLNVGGDGYHEKVSEIFILSGDNLIIAGSDGFETYSRCK